ncbi:hypothetical protein I4U23_012491 [Adineta vaga]|nr:hypothetical protein I4U23_012491 [Adineta vaga]
MPIIDRDDIPSPPSIIIIGLVFKLPKPFVETFYKPSPSSIRTTKKTTTVLMTTEIFTGSTETTMTSTYNTTEIFTGSTETTMTSTYNTTEVSTVPNNVTGVIT